MAYVSACKGEYNSRISWVLHITGKTESLQTLDLKQTNQTECKVNTQKLHVRGIRADGILLHADPENINSVVTG